jgi:CubicO group peptidase (beta-lactamase class C family)
VSPHFWEQLKAFTDGIHSPNNLVRYRQSHLICKFFRPEMTWLKWRWLQRAYHEFVKGFKQYKTRLYQRVFNTVDVPEHLSDITDLDRGREVNPGSVALDAAAVDNIWTAAQDLYRTGVYPLLSLCLRRRGEIVLNRSMGYQEEGKIATVDTPVCLLSASKCVSAVLIHLLAEQGKIHLMDPVSYYIPQFAARGKGYISIQQLLSHRAGVPSVPEGTDIELLFDHEAALQLICDSEPEDHQGRIQAYHTITSGFLIDELIRVTTGMNAQQFLNRYISKPMGMRYFRYGLTKKDRPKAAVNVQTGANIALINRGLTSILGVDPAEVVEVSNDERFFSAIVPSANLFATAEEVSRFFQMLLNRGEWNGKQILQPLTVYKATRAFGKSELDRSLKLPMRYSPGFMLGGAPYGIYGPDTEYAYGHLGFANIMCWADPEREISVSIMNTGKLALGPHLKTLPALVISIAEQCPALVDMEDELPIHRRGEAPSSPT